MNCWECWLLLETDYEYNPGIVNGENFRELSYHTS
jgi:hypothetical protein